MIQELLTILPSVLNRLSPGSAMVASAGAAALWLTGARFTRSLLTLAAVGAGAFVGLRLPQWFAWGIDGMGLAVAGAIVFGVAAWMLHRTWVGLMLGLLLALWASIGVWIGAGVDAIWSLPSIHLSANTSDMLSTIWRSLPTEVSKTIPYACACGMASGIILSILWSKLSRVLLCSLLGVSVLLALGLPALLRAQPTVVHFIPTAASSQVLILIGVIVLGSVVQWLLTPGDAKASPPAKSKAPAKPAARARSGNPRRKVQEVHA